MKDWKMPRADADSTPLWNTRAAVCIAAAVVFLATLILYTPGNWIFACVVLLTDGAKAAGWLLGAIALGWVLLRAVKLRSNPLLQVATAGGLGLGVFGLIGLGLGLAGLLNRGVALALPIGSIAIFLADQLRRGGLPDSDTLRENAGAWLRAPAGRDWLWLIPVVSLATAALAACVMPGDLWKPLDPHPYDVVSYHLQVPREWYERGRIVPLDHNVFSYFPFNVEIQFLLLMHAAGGAMGPWSAMYACQLLNVGYAALLAGAVAGSAEGGMEDERRTPNTERPTSKLRQGGETRQATPFDFGRSASGVRRWSSVSSLIAAAIVSCVPWVIMLASVAYVESALMLYTALALVWTFRFLALSARGVCGALLLSGVFAGLAAGVKITAVPMLVLAIPIALLATRRSKQAVFGCLIFLLAAGVTLAPWLVRTAIWSGGNPLFPVAMHTLGRGHFSPEQVERFVTAHSPTPAERPWGARLRTTWTDVLAQWQFGYVLLPMGIVAVILRRRDPAVRFLAVAGLVTFVVWIGFTHLLGRFLIQLVPLAGLLLARVRWGRAWPTGVIVALTAAVLGWAGVYPRLTYTTHNPEHPERAILLGVQNLGFMVPQELGDTRSGGKRVALVGDAGAFLYQVPMADLRYRTVFDVPAGSDDPVRAWAGGDVMGDPHWLLVINPSEIARLHSTYRFIPPLPAAWRDRDEPFVIGGDAAR